MSAAASTPSAVPRAEVGFHDAECGAYAADLSLWAELAGAVPAGEPILDLGAGTGRVALSLAAAGHRVLAVEREPALAAELARRAGEASPPLAVELLERDARALGELPAPVALALAPMQFLQLLDREDRASLLATVAASLRPGALLAAALLDEAVPLSSGEPDPLPDVREIDGWVYSSLPLDVRVGAETIEIVRLRQIVSPAGELRERQQTTLLHRLTAAQLAEEAAELGFRAGGIERVGQTDDHVASVALLLERGPR